MISPSFLQCNRKIHRKTVVFPGFTRKVLLSANNPSELEMSRKGNRTFLAARKRQDIPQKIRINTIKWRQHIISIIFAQYRDIISSHFSHCVHK